MGPDQKGDAILSAYMPGGSPGMFGKIKDFFVFRSQLVPLSTLQAGYRLLLHGLAAESLHAQLVQIKRAQVAAA